MEIDEEIVSKIEKALGFTLYDNQKEYIFNNKPMDYTRRNGRTVAYCIKLCLSEGEPLPLYSPHEYADYVKGLDKYQYITYANGYFMHTFMEIWNKLRDAGFIVRKLQLPNKMMYMLDVIKNG